MRRSNDKNIRRSVYSFIFLFLLSAMLLSEGCSDKKLPAVSQGGSGKDTLDVAIVYGPLSYYLYNDTLGGINYDVMRHYERQCSVAVKFWPIVDLQTAYSKLENGDYDILASVAADYDIRKRFLTTENVFLDRLVLVQQKDNKGSVEIKSALDLAGKEVFIGRGSPALTRLENLANEIGDSILVRQIKDMSDEYLCIKVAVGDLPRAVVNERIADRMTGLYTNLSYENPVSFTQFQSWLFNPDDTLRYNHFNSWLKNFKETSDYKSLLEKY